MMETETQTKNEQIIEIPEEKLYLKAEIEEIWTPHIIIAKNVSDMTYYEELIKITINGQERYIDRYTWRYYIIENCNLTNTYDIDRLKLFIDMPYLNKHLFKSYWYFDIIPFEPLVLVSLNDLKDKKPGDIIIQREFGENGIFPFYSKCIFYPDYLIYDFVINILNNLYVTTDSKEFPYLKIYVTLRSAELSFKSLKNGFYSIRYTKGSYLFEKINELLNKERDNYIVKYFITHFKEDDYLKKEFFEDRDIIELYNILEPIRLYKRNEYEPKIKPPKDHYKDIQKLKKKIENDLKGSLIYKAIRSYNFSIK